MARSPLSALKWSLKVDVLDPLAIYGELETWIHRNSHQLSIRARESKLRIAIRLNPRDFKRIKEVPNLEHFYTKVALPGWWRYTMAESIPFRGVIFTLRCDKSIKVGCVDFECTSHPRQLNRESQYQKQPPTATKKRALCILEGSFRGHFYILPDGHIPRVPTVEEENQPPQMWKESDWTEIMKRFIVPEDEIDPSQEWQEGDIHKICGCPVRYLEYHL